eukprot:CAMPEP_0177295976 /NCGR_PEP_ID=MMETSP0368-20130122/2171_1 /TAXON_ID=447022 ORGANISM="Scrippsiella hangoei-like, Strain SHHI-4" /NCGR_SAMPLE_ID=MMETSP0368 /ASSEMBLY_ACC=CAM_ASM_000363 /LENGTH=332 /DNA_ID=CAMNT_0018754061 /DNA_START=18 /DNA_END=1016 /DNA_ORIENTATION=-
MPPKRASSRGAAKGKAKAKAMVGAAATEAALDPRAELEKEAEFIFESLQPENDLKGVLKLAQFAEVIRMMNRRKCTLWGDDPAVIIKREWTSIGGSTSREATLAQFKAWWPDFFEATNAEIAAKDAAGEAEAAEKAARFAGDGMWKVVLRDLKDAIMEARNKGKTPLIIDNTENHRAEAFFALSLDVHIIECKKMIMDTSKAKGATVEEVLEEERQRFIKAKCFKYGKTVLFRLANTACDLKGAFNSEVFPSLALFDAAEVARVSADASKVKDSPFYKMALDRDEVLDLEAYGIASEFNVVALTHFQEDEYEEYLQSAIPLHLFQPIFPLLE